MALTDTYTPEMSLAQWDITLAKQPDNAMAHLRRGIALGALSRIDEAAAAFEEAVRLLPAYADAWICLGDARLAQGDRRGAKKAIIRASKLDPGAEGLARSLQQTCGFTEYVLRFFLTRAPQPARKIDIGAVEAEATSFLRAGYIAEAMVLLLTEYGQRPPTAAACLALGNARFAHGYIEQAEEIYRYAIAQWPNDPHSHYCMGAYLIERGLLQAGTAELEECRRLDPHNETNILTLLAATGRGPIPEALHPAYVKSLFDKYAKRFDSHLLDVLEYRVPEMIGNRLASQDRTWARVVDIGCGTGLCGARIRPHAQFLAGIDLSTNMINQARARNVYDELHEGDAVQFLQDNMPPFDLAVAADVLIYIGEVRPLLKALKARLQPSGQFWFSVEDTNGDKLRINQRSRYQHSRRYIDKAALECGFRVRSVEPINIRNEAYAPVPGLFVVLENRAPG